MYKTLEVLQPPEFRPPENVTHVSLGKWFQAHQLMLEGQPDAASPTSLPLGKNGPDGEGSLAHHRAKHRKETEEEQQDIHRNWDNKRDGQPPFRPSQHEQDPDRDVPASENPHDCHSACV